MTEMTEPSLYMMPFPCEFGISVRSIAVVQKNSDSGNQLVPQTSNLLISSQDMDERKIIGLPIRIT